jgi:hypothetical protein
MAEFRAAVKDLVLGRRVEGYQLVSRRSITRTPTNSRFMRTKDAPRAAKAWGTRLGNPNLGEARQRALAANQKAADAFAANSLPTIKQTATAASTACKRAKFCGAFPSNFC